MTQNKHSFLLKLDWRALIVKFWAVGSVNMDGWWMQDDIGELLQVSPGGRETDRLRADGAWEDGRQPPDTCPVSQRRIHHDHLQCQKQAEDRGSVPAAGPLRRLLRHALIPRGLLLLCVGIREVKVRMLLDCFEWDCRDFRFGYLQLPLESEQIFWLVLKQWV